MSARGWEEFSQKEHLTGRLRNSKRPPPVPGAKGKGVRWKKVRFESTHLGCQRVSHGQHSLLDGWQFSTIIQSGWARSRSFYKTVSSQVVSGKPRSFLAPLFSFFTWPLQPVLRNGRLYLGCVCLCRFVVLSPPFFFLIPPPLFIYLALLTHPASSFLYFFWLGT